MADLKPQNIDWQMSANRQAHSTVNYNSQELILRRGQPFRFSLTLNRVLRSGESLGFIASTGPSPSESAKTKAVFSLSNGTSGGSWYAQLVSQRENTLDISISSPANAPIGWYTLNLQISSQGNNFTLKLGMLILLFNPWSQADSVFMNNQAERQEYVLEDSGAIFVGSTNRISMIGWNFGQFEGDILNICLAILDSSLNFRRDPATDVARRGDPKYVGRVLSAMVNSNDDNGVIAGNWSGSYAGGRDPRNWNGSVEILKEWKKSGFRPVRFGQCWVFAGTLNTVLRCFGIPARVITNFNSAHDTDRNLSVDVFYDPMGNPLDKGSDSVWNFHVWNESWFVRNDLGPSYNGWQVLDATPQERSQGVFQCGPASVTAVREGDVNLDFDMPFIFAEVNADRITWIYDARRNTQKQNSSDTNTIGRYISTKAVGSYSRMDVTEKYKYPEGSSQERQVFDKAVGKLKPNRTFGPTSSTEVERDEREPSISGVFKVNGILAVGKEVNLALTLKNLTRDTKTVTVNMTAWTIVYNGTLVHEVWKDSVTISLDPEEVLFISNGPEFAHSWFRSQDVFTATRRLSLNNDIFEANSDSDQQSETKEDTSPKKKKKKLKQREEKSPDDLKKKKAKTGKLKEKSKPDLENSEISFFDLRTKKRISEAKEELKESKKPKKDDIKETKELKKVKKGEIRDLKTKIKEDSKENRKTRKEKCVEPQLDSESDLLNDFPFQEGDSEDLQSDNREEKLKIKSGKDKAGLDAAQDAVLDKHLDSPGSADEDADVRGRRNKKKPRKAEELKESKKLENKNLSLEKKNAHKKQRNQDKSRSTTESDNLISSLAQTLKSSRVAGEERGLRSTDSAGEEKETKKNESKEKYQKRHDLDKEEKGRKEPKGLNTFKEIRNAFDLFKLTPEGKNDFPENNQKREETPLDCNFAEDHKTKENNQVLKERRNTRDETDTWACIAAEGDQDVLDGMCPADENSDGRQQILSLGMDLQLEWMKLEDFQKHLDGEDENFPVTDAIPSNLLRDAVKNGDYITVKVALNSNEEYNLDQEDSSGMTLVMLAAAGGQDDLLRLLIRKGAKVNGRQKNGTTALIHAAEKNFLTTVAILLEAGAFVNVQQSSGETALMKACKRGNLDIVRLVIECGADCNILSKHQTSAMYFAKQCNNVLVYDLLKNHLDTLSRVAEETIKDYFEARLALLEPIFPIACHRLCEGPDFSMDFNYKPPQNITEGSGILLFIFHANFLGKDVIARLCGPCSVQAVILNDKFQLPVFLDSHFVYSFSPVAGLNKLFIRLTEAPSAKVKLLIGAYRVQLQ